MRKDVQEIFKATPHSKQVMMFSATLSKDIRPVCKKFMQDVSIISFDVVAHYTNTIIVLIVHQFLREISMFYWHCIMNQIGLSVPCDWSLRSYG